jgi:hypothetical protein
MIIDVGLLDVKLIKLLQAQYMRNLAEELCRVQPINVKDISDPATNENIFTWSYAKAVFERNAQARWEDDGGSCLVN